MKVIKYQATDEKTILTAMIMHTGALARIQQGLARERRPFRNKWSNLIASWCLDYFGQYHKAPGKQIENLFTKFAQEEPDEAAIRIVETFLSNLSSDYAAGENEINEGYAVDLASRYFHQIKLARLAEDISVALERNDTKEAQEKVDLFKPVRFSQSDWIDPLRKKQVIQTLDYYSEDRSLVKFPGDMGVFLSPFFERTGFVSLCGPEKRGKSYWLLEFLWRAIQQRRRSLYYVLGDMSEQEALMRLYCRMAQRPQHEQEILYPTRIFQRGWDEDRNHPKLHVEFEARQLPSISLGAIRKGRERLISRIATGDPLLKVKVEGIGMISASDIERDVEHFNREGWIVDLVVVDYADLLASEPGLSKQDFRHQINASWGVLRRIALKNHLLLLTATQAAARSYDAWTIRKKDFSEDKRKNAHVTGMLGINQTAEEKAREIYRLNWVFLRHGRWSDAQVLWTVGNLSLCCPCIKTLLPDFSKKMEEKA